MEDPGMREAILSRARQEAGALLEDARKRADETVRKAAEQQRQRSEAQRRRLLSDASREASRIIAQAELRSRQELLKEKDAIIGEMLERLRRLIIGTAPRTETLAHLISEAVGAFQSDEPLKILTLARDLNAVKGIVQSDPGLRDRITGVEEARCMGGVICESADGQVSVNNTFDTRIEMLVPKMMPRVGGLLFGDNGS
jgi:vacuolar-type H+-ATPase subunit E/Vma4